MDIDVVVLGVLTNGFDQVPVRADACAGKAAGGGYQGDDNASGYTQDALMDVGRSGRRNVLNRQLKTYFPLAGVESHEGLTASIQISLDRDFLGSG